MHIAAQREIDQTRNVYSLISIVEYESPFAYWEKYLFLTLYYCLGFHYSMVRTGYVREARRTQLFQVAGNSKIAFTKGVELAGRTRTPICQCPAMERLIGTWLFGIGVQLNLICSHIHIKHRGINQHISAHCCMSLSVFDNDKKGISGIDPFLEGTRHFR